MCTLQHLQLGREIGFQGKSTKKYVNIRCRKDLQGFFATYFKYKESLLEYQIVGLFYQEQRVGCWLVWMK